MEIINKRTVELTKPEAQAKAQFEHLLNMGFGIHVAAARVQEIASESRPGLLPLPTRRGADALPATRREPALVRQRDAPNCKRGVPGADNPSVPKSRRLEMPTIELDCPPGNPRPGDLIEGVLEGTGLAPGETVARVFGCWVWSFDMPEKEWEEDPSRSSSLGSRSSSMLASFGTGAGNDDPSLSALPLRQAAALLHPGLRSSDRDDRGTHTSRAALSLLPQGRQVMSFWLMARLWEILGCQIYEDLSALCGPFVWSVPW